MDHWKRSVQQRRDAWEYLRTRAQADVMLLQECVPLQDMGPGRSVHRRIGGHRPWGSSVVALAEEAEAWEIDTVRTRYGRMQYSMLGHIPGAVIVARANLPGCGPITCVSVYCAMDLYAQTTMFRIVADLIPLFDSPDGARVVVGGDFNVTTALHPNKLELPRYKAIFSAIESLGLTDLSGITPNRPDPIPECPCLQPDCRHFQTFESGTQLDWMYATPELACRCTRVRIDRSVWPSLSDHVPIIAEFEIPDPVSDRESFLKELGIRSGPQNVPIAEDLISWALELQEEYEIAALDRLPVAEDPSRLWFQLDHRYTGKLLQWTFSLFTDGRLEVQFQYMMAPLDKTQDGMKEREWLRSELNRIDGVDLAEARLKGRPTFPLSALAAEEPRNLFKQAFSKMIERTLALCEDTESPYSGKPTG